MSINISYSSLVEEAKSLAKEETKTEKTQFKKKPSTTYKVLNVSGPDMVVERKTVKTNLIMVFLVSQQKILIKNLLTEEIKEISNTDFSSFFKDLPANFKWEDEEGNKPVWLADLGKSAMQCSSLLKVINNKSLLPWLKAGFVKIDFKKINTDSEIRFKTELFDFKEYAKISKYFPDEYLPVAAKIMEKLLILGGYNYYNGEESEKYEKISSLISYIQISGYKNRPIEEKWGFDGLRQAVEKYFSSQLSSFPKKDELAELLGSNKAPGYWHSVKNKGEAIDFDFQSFLNYVFESSVVQGYANTISNFITSWKDDLFMQTHLYAHGVKEKYPQYLASHEKLMSYKYDLVKKEIDQKQFEAMSARMEKFERYGDKYIIISPKCADDVIEEARQQDNCLASYIRRILSGEVMIFFLRLKEDPENSLVTIEIRGDYRLGQVKRKFNRSPSSEELEFVNKWWKEKFEKLYNSTANM